MMAENKLKKGFGCARPNSMNTRVGHKQASTSDYVQGKDKKIRNNKKLKPKL